MTMVRSVSMTSFKVVTRASRELQDTPTLLFRCNPSTLQPSTAQKPEAPVRVHPLVWVHVTKA